jgi:carboxypeptidase D
MLGDMSRTLSFSEVLKLKLIFSRYISAAMLDQKDKEFFDLSGALTYDPCIGNFDFVQEEVPAVPYVVANNNLFNFNASFLAQLEELHKSCGYAAYIEKYLTFPASGVQPPRLFNFSDPTDNKCDVFDLINFAAFDPNPCFDIYEITTMVCRNLHMSSFQGLC